MSHTVSVASEDDSTVTILFDHRDDDNPLRETELAPGLIVIERQQENGWWLYALSVDTFLFNLEWKAREDA